MTWADGEVAYIADGVPQGANSRHHERERIAPVDQVLDIAAQVRKVWITPMNRIVHRDVSLQISW